jgi:putative hydrolase of HD superfamily
MKRIELENVLPFIEMLHALQGVKRIIDVPNEERYENDLEHSYLLAMAAWYVIDTYELPLNRDKVIRYALAHDMPEVYAGDTYVFSKDATLMEGKKERERQARAKLQEVFPTVPAMHEAMENYETCADPEAVFVRALDKLMPMFVNYLQDGRGWKKEQVSFSQVTELKRRTTNKSPEVADLLEQLIRCLEKDRSRFFGELVE